MFGHAILIVTSLFSIAVQDGTAIGCSTQLVSEQISTQRVHVVYNQYTHSNRYGFYNYDGCKQNGTVAPIEGVYFLSSSLVLENNGGNGETWRVKVYFREKFNPEKRYCVGTESIHVNTQTVSTTCFARLELRTDLEVVLEDGIGLVIVPWLSTFSIQYIGASGIVAALIRPLEEITSSRNERTKYDESGFVNSLTVLEGDGKIPITCSGLYILSFMMSANFGDTTSSFDVSAGAVKFFTLSQQYRMQKSLKIITFYRVVELKAGDPILVRKQNLELKEGAVFSLIKIRDLDEDSGSFDTPLSLKMGDQNYPVITFKGNEARRSNSSRDINNTTMLEVDTENNQFINVKSYGLYVVSMDMVLTAPSVDITVTLSVTNKADNGVIQIEDGISVTRKDISASKSLLSLRGIIGVPALAFLSLKLFTNENLENKLVVDASVSVLSLTHIPNHVLVGAVETVVPKKNECKNGKIFLRNTRLAGYDLNKYILRNETKFDVPTSGVYLVHLNQTLMLNPKNPINFTVLLTHSRQGRVLSTTQEILHPHDNLFLGSFSRLMVLQQHDKVELWTTCGKSLHVKFRSIFILVASVTNLNFYIKDHIVQNILPAQLSNSYSVRSAGTYLVTLNVLLKFENLPEKELLSVSVKRFTPSLDQNTTLVNEERSMRSVVMGTHGLVSIPILTFARLEANDQIIITISYTPNNLFSLKIMNYHFSYVLLSNELHKIYGFRAVQVSSRLFNFASHVTTPNNFLFDTQYGGFKLAGTNMFGPQVVVTKQMTLFYIVSVTLENVMGTFWLSLQIPPERGDQAITSKVTILKKQTIILKASGILRVEFGETVVFLVNGASDEDLVMCSKSVWSLMEITPPTPNDYKIWTAEKDEGVGKKRNSLMKSSNHLSVQRSQNGAYSNVLSIDDKPRYEIGASENEVHPLQNDHKINQLNITNYTQSIGNYLGLTFINHTECVVSFIQTESTDSRVLLSGNHSLESFEINNEGLFLVCLNLNLSIQSTLNTTSVKLLQFASVFSAFSASLHQRTNVTLAGGNNIRLDFWSTALPPSFDHSDGYREGHGMFVVPTNGFYFVSIRLLVQTIPSFEGCSLVLKLDDAVLATFKLKRQTVYNDVSWFLKDSALQCTVFCTKNETKLTFIPGSVFSSMLIDSRPTLTETCFENNLILSINKRQVFTQVQTSFQITCHNTRRSISDFLWKKNGKVVSSNLGTRDGLLRFDWLTVDNDGHYQCVMIRGKHVIESKVVHVIVIDPRPQLNLSNRTVFVDENTISNPLVAWVQATAYNVTSNQRAIVKLSIIKGNHDSLFYFHPAVTKTISSLRYRRPLDFELKQTYTVQFTAQNMEYDGSLGVVTNQIQIQVVNRNEHLPKFAPHTGMISVEENASIGTLIDCFTANDSDATRTRLSYALAETPNSNLFQMNSSTGCLRVAGVIDYEETRSILLIAVADDGLHRTHKQLNVKIINANDNRPHFPTQKYSAKVIEDSAPGFRILDVKVTDGDEGDDVRMEIKGGNDDGYMGLSGHSIVVSKRIPQAGVYRLTLLAFDSGGLESGNEATVDIEFVADSRKRTTATPPPAVKIFKKNFYNIQILESSKIGSVVYKFNIDRPVNKTVLFQLKEINNNGKAVFRINDEASIILLSPLDTRAYRKHYLVVSACVVVQNESTCELCHVTFQVEEDENSSMRFVTKQVTLFVSENTKPGSLVTKLKVRGRKTPENRYEIVNSSISDSFRIGSLDGRLYLHAELNYTLFRNVQLTVYIYQGPYLILDSCSVLVNVLQGSGLGIIDLDFDQQATNNEKEDLLHWKYIVPLASFILLLLLVLALLILCRQVKRTRRKVNRFKEELKNNDDIKTSFLAYFTETGESMEDMMRFSCESIPSAYRSITEIDHVTLIDQSETDKLSLKNESLTNAYMNNNVFLK